MRRVWAAAIMVAVFALGGCAVSVSESRLDDYKIEAEERVAEIVELIPGELQPSPVQTLDSSGRMLQNPISADPSPNDSVWWQVDANVELGSGPGSSERASTALVDGMTADGWEHERVRETSEGRLVTEGFRRDDWYVEVVWVTAASGLHEAIDIRVLSPKTVRGDHDEIRS
ncbi:hypothetical protein ACFC14_08825 [Microbacterium sp. NPDC055988]|uniref:hypothetical protein n=1 Tax=Microbacterium sp. NPDC055988 TaxID=3345671 RepID=UPI0035E2AB44